MATEECAAPQDQPQQQQTAEWFKYSRRVVLKSILAREDGGLGLVGERVVVGGWVRSRKERAEHGVQRPPRAAPSDAADVTCCEALVSRIPLLRLMARVLVGKDGPPLGNPEIAPSKKGTAVVYVRINDGSCVANLQLAVDRSMSLLGQIMSIGTSILVEGVLQRPLIPGKHIVELKVEKMLHVGIVDLNKYPLTRTRLSLELLRAYPHLRPRAATVASIARIRNALSYATHMFFQNNGFLYVHMPIITTSDTRECEKMFQVTTLLSESDDAEKLSGTNDREFVSLEAVKATIKEKSSRIEELKRSDSNREALLAALQDIQKANELALQLEAQRKSKFVKVGEVDFSKDFFSRQAYLSVSARLHLESYACALSSVYTFGPIFRVESPRSVKQLAEMWMVEVELAFAELEDAMNCAEDFLKFLCQSVLENSFDDIKFRSKRAGKSYFDRLQSMKSIPFVRITYTEALEVLNKEPNKISKTKVEWGSNLSKEHESYLADEVYKRPVIIYQHPKEVKPFYTRIEDDGRTVSAFDIIAPKAGVLIRGCQREERFDMISRRIEEQGLPREQFEWYLDLRRHGAVKHSGFSLGFENMVMFAAGLEDMRDAIPFHRTFGHALS